jgi:FkbM family methyltransferase
MLPEIFYLRVYDVPFCPIRPGDLVVDIGANHGFYACYAAHYGARVQAFEPDPISLPLLHYNIEANDLVDRITVHSCAVGQQSGTTDLYITQQLGGGMSSTMPQFVRNAGITDATLTKVKSCRLDEAVPVSQGNVRIRVLKLDCEGAELDILRSLTREYLSHVDAIALEFHRESYQLEDLVDLALSWGDYQLSAVATGELGNAILHLTNTRQIRHWAEAQSVHGIRAQIRESPVPLPRVGN